MKELQFDELQEINGGRWKPDRNTLLPIILDEGWDFVKGVYNGYKKGKKKYSN